MLIEGDAGRAFLARIRANPINAALLDRLPGLGLPDCWLVAGCLFQTIWNMATGQPPTAGIDDYDVFYFDGSDLSYEAEDDVIGRVSAACAGLPGRIEVRNQARVHLWYRQRFGHDYPPLASSTDGIDRFLVECTCVGVDCGGEQSRVYATYGLDDMSAGLLRPNARNRNPDLYAQKCDSYRRRWPWLSIHEA